MIGRTAFYSSTLFILSFLPALGQDSKKSPQDWFVRDPETDQVQGVSVDRAYQAFLQGKPSRTIVVAVIDSGVDIDHEDLKNVIWLNEDEIPGNSIDDDNNGYVDDVHGWNFIGGKDGNVTEDTYELTREYIRLSKVFANAPEGKMTRKQKAAYANYKKIKDKYEKLRDTNQQQYNLFRSVYNNIVMSIDTLKKVMKVDKLTQAELDTFHTTNPTLAFAKGFTTTMLQRMGNDGDIDDLIEELESELHTYEVIVEYGYNPDYNSRLIVGDTYSNLEERSYGNRDVKGEDADHGTHVAGIIAADRNNNLGIKGIADNVKIMSIRTVPNGDERDKDVANAIRYAVDNGAQIVNMSFGKTFSPEKNAVDLAVKYAEKKGVLLIHASGNESNDIDYERNFPSRYYLDGKEAKNWLEVGASTAGKGDKLAADFSNYGKKSVDLFAPGENIYSTSPGNKYSNMDGTSFAAPVVTGVAALIMSYFPDLTYLQVIDILKKSTRKFDGLIVQKPGRGKASFSDLSNTGGIVNAYEAVKMATTIKSVPVEH